MIKHRRREWTVIIWEFRHISITASCLSCPCQNHPLLLVFWKNWLLFFFQSKRPTSRSSLVWCKQLLHSQSSCLWCSGCGCFKRVLSDWCWRDRVFYFIWCIHQGTNWKIKKWCVVVHTGSNSTTVHTYSLVQLMVTLLLKRVHYNTYKSILNNHVSLLFYKKWE